MTAWKKQSPYKSFLKTTGYRDSLKNSSSLIGAVMKDLYKLEFKPLGGSFVIFIPAYKTEVGN